MSEKYKVIYADPPWAYRNYEDTTASRWVGNHYPVFGVDDLSVLPVGQVADKDCALFLWTTPPCLQEALSVIKAWGFQYKTKAFCWVKTNKKSDSWFWGMGYWTRANTEDCWLCTRGSPKRASAGVHQVVKAPVSKHSQKPIAVRDRIVQLCGDVPRLELFARERTPGWDAMGFDIDGKDIRLALVEKIVELEDGGK